MNDDTTTATSATPRQRLQVLWGLMLRQCTWYMQHTPPSEIRSEYLNVIRSFLKDNGIDADLVHRDDVRSSLKKLESLQLPFNS